MMLAPIEMIRRTVDPMIERGFGRIVNIVSRSVKTPQAELGLSNGARAAPGRVCRRPGAPDGAAQRDDQQHAAGRLCDRRTAPPCRGAGEVRRQVVRRSCGCERSQANPAGRFGQADEVGALCAYLCSSQAGYMTGQSLLIDGGGYPGTF